MELNPILNLFGSILEGKIFTNTFPKENGMFKEILQTKNFKKENIIIGENLYENLFPELSFLFGVQDPFFEDSESNFLIPIKNPQEKSNLWGTLIVFESESQAYQTDKGENKDLGREVPIKVTFPFNFNEKFIKNIHPEIFLDGKKDLFHIPFQKAFDPNQWWFKKVFLGWMNSNELNRLNEPDEKKDVLNLFLTNEIKYDSFREFILPLFKKGMDQLDQFLIIKRFGGLNFSQNNFQQSDEHFDWFIGSRVNVFQNCPKYFGDRDPLNLLSVTLEGVDKGALDLNIADSLNFPNENFLQKEEIPSQELSKGIKFIPGQSKEVFSIIEKELTLDQNNHLRTIKPGNIQELFIPDEEREMGLHSSQTKIEPSENIKFILDEFEGVRRISEGEIAFDQNGHSGNIRPENSERLVIQDETELGLPSSQTKIEPSEVYQQIGKQIIANLKNNEERIRLTLDPPELGCIHVEIKNEQKKVELFFWADRAVTKDLLESNRVLLVEILRKDGFRLERLEIFFHPEEGSFQNERETQIGQNRKFFKETRKAGKYQSEKSIEISPVIPKYFLSGTNYIDLIV